MIRRVCVALALALASCRDAPAPARWPMDEATGPLQLVVRHPRPDAPRPRSGRDYVMGSTGNGRATLRVNGMAVPVERNGSFLAYLPAPATGSAHEVIATLGSDSARVSVRVGGDVALSAPAASEAPTRGPVVLVPPDNMMAAASLPIPARDEPDGDYAWFLLPGTEGVIGDARGTLRRVTLAGDAAAWIDTGYLRPARPSAPRGTVASSVRVEETLQASQVLVASPRPLPFQVTEEGSTLAFTVFGATAGRGTVPGRGYIAGVTWDDAGRSAVQLRVPLRGPAYGYEVRWQAGAMVLRVRHPPLVDATRSLAGLTIVVDAGHPPGGAMGPTGLAEPVVTLDVAQRVAALLTARGARAVLTRRDTGAFALDERVALTRAAEAHAFVSIHADAIAPGADPSRDIGTAVYAHRGESLSLAEAVQSALVARLRLPDRGALRGDYAVVRATWLPAVLCEGATMTVPAQEAALASPGFRQEYAQGVVDGLERYFRELGRRR